MPKNNFFGLLTFCKAQKNSRRNFLLRWHGDIYCDKSGGILIL